MILLVSKRASHFEIFDKSDIPNSALNFLYNKKGFKVIECHAQGIIKHCINNIKERKNEPRRMRQLEK
jgi:hypothetical protein